MLLNCDPGEDSWESLGIQGDQTSQSYRKSTLNIIGRTDAEAEAPILWSPYLKSWLIGKDPDAGKDWGQKEEGASEDEMAGRYHGCNEDELGQTLGDGEGQGGLAWGSSWGCKESDTTGQLNNNNKKKILITTVLQLYCSEIKTDNQMATVSVGTDVK